MGVTSAAETCTVYLDHAFRGVTNIFVDLNRDEDIHAVFRLPAILPFELLTLCSK